MGHQQASVLGRMSLGSREAVIEQASNKHDDPACTIMNQHFRVLHKIVAWNQTPFGELEEAFANWVKRVQGALAHCGGSLWSCYLKALGWSASSHALESGDESFHLLTPSTGSVCGSSRPVTTLKDGVAGATSSLKKCPSRLHTSLGGCVAGRN